MIEIEKESKVINNKELCVRRGKERTNDLKKLADFILEISKQIDFKVSSRGWCYLLEGERLVNKNDFDRLQKYINECRKKGFLPIDFVAEDSSRQIQNVYYPTNKDPIDRIISFLNHSLNNLGENHKPSFWKHEKYFIQVMVEKVDLVTLFKPICKKYKIAITNGKGWSVILQRAELADNFKKMEEEGCIPVILYFGDHDPAGILISDKLKAHFKDIEGGTGWNPVNLIVDRFGLDYKFIIESNLTWIDNLKTGGKKEANEKLQYVADYIAKFGRRKVEANAVMKNSKPVEKLFEDKILEYLGNNFLKRFDKHKEEIITKYNKIMEESGCNEGINKSIELLEEYKRNIKNSES